MDTAHGKGSRNLDKSCDILGCSVVLEVVRDTKQLPGI